MRKKAELTTQMMISIAIFVILLMIGLLIYTTEFGVDKFTAIFEGMGLG